MKRLKYLLVALALAASSCCKPAVPFASRSNPPPSPPTAVVAPSIWSFEFSNVTAGDLDVDPPLLPTVWVKIIKHDPDAGEVMWTRIHKEGRQLGFDENGTSVHGVYSEKKNRQLPVDFNCGGKIEKIRVDKEVVHEYEVCNPKAGRQGPACNGPEKMKHRYRVNEVVYTVENSKRQTFLWAYGSGPRSDRRCPAHGGPAIPEKQTPEELLALRVVEATELLDEADTLWVSDRPSDKKKAQEIYRKLASSFADTTAVMPRKAELHQRSKKRIN